ncbi:hypothetical protein RIF29_28699 [Crotalaria pallida]|uniref:DYW domain-containing protein n=1 Tax=Crotalaria pallida TaxID=3830 RepID=A0AAN9HV93_CROPI
MRADLRTLNNKKFADIEVMQASQSRELRSIQLRLDADSMNSQLQQIEELSLNKCIEAEQKVHSFFQQKAKALWLMVCDTLSCYCLLLRKYKPWESMIEPAEKGKKKLYSTITSDADNIALFPSTAAEETKTTMAEDYRFTKEDLTVNESLGYPKAYTKLCSGKGFGPYRNGPPFTFIPYALIEDEAERARELDQVFPIMDPKAKPTTKPKIFASLLWKQLSHLGNAGFDPKVIRVDAYGNVLYYHADSASPLAWDIDHWFPCSTQYRKMMAEKNLKKEVSCSWIIVKGKVHRFVVGERHHPQIEHIYSKLKQLNFAVKKNEECLLNEEDVLCDFSERKEQLLDHSERQAIAYGLISTPAETPIMVFKNTRSCKDCHDFAKSVSMVTGGGLTVVSNLRILQRQACKRKKNKLEFLVPWWDFQLGISVNQFLSIFASSNSDFRYRAFSFLFSEGENHELNASQIVDSHSFPQHFIGLKQQVGLAPAAIVESRKESFDALALRQIDYNKKPRSMSPAIVAASKSKVSILKENEDPQFEKNPYQAIVMTRDSLKQREENARVHAEIQKLDNEVNEMRLTNEEEKLIIQDLESTLTNRRRKAEKCRRLAEAQCSYRTMLEKMIRDAMHQSVIYKEQVRLNQAASNALMARLEAQREICDAAEKELLKKYKQRDELEKEIRHEWEQGRKRLRIDYSGTSSENEEPKEDEKEEELKITADDNIAEEILDDEYNRAFVAALEEEKSIKLKLQNLEISKVVQETETEEDEERWTQRGKGNMEKWLQRLLENSHEDKDQQDTNENGISGTEEIIKQLNQKYPQKEPKISKASDYDYKEKQLQLVQDKKKTEWTEKRMGNEGRNVIMTGHKDYNEEVSCIGVGNGITSFEGMERKEQHKMEKKIVRSESARALRRIPSSPSLLLSGMRKGVERITKKLMY